MPKSLRIALTADLHWGHRRGQDAVRMLAEYVTAHPPDLFVLAGDVGTSEHFEGCLSLFDGLGCKKALVPGNHDIWILSRDQELGYDSLRVYDEHLPRKSAEHHFHFLDHGPLIFPESDLALVGSINWYDYSWGVDGLRQHHPGEEHRLQSKRFPRGRYNDVNYVRWPLDDGTFTARVAEAMTRHLEEALRQVGHVIIITHHPPFYGLGFPSRGEPLKLDRFLWDAFCGNRTVESLLARHADQISFAFCGHTHRERENNLGPIRGYNIGGDYHYKRLLLLDWPARTVVAHQFGDPNAVATA